ncbi:MAG: CAP domain-containing protein [Methanomicrobiales archaeon]|jgi:uncharacterized protein YkwD|nr:CAP domain-containing protein [Methanomicrobiales archaeon]
MKLHTIFLIVIVTIAMVVSPVIAMQAYRPTLSTISLVDAGVIPAHNSNVNVQLSDSVRPISGRIERAIILQTNKQRAAHGLGNLSTDYTLRSIARWMCKDMALYHYLGHTDHLGRQFWERYDAREYTYLAGAENNAAGFADSGTPNQIARQIMNLWMGSPSYRNYILGNYNRIGVGLTYGRVISGGNTYTGWIVIQDFARQ